jgi:hypothetical protein
MKGALSRFLKLCGTPAVPVGSILIIEDFDRLSREYPDDAWEMFRDILLAGVEIVVLSMDRWFTKESLNRFEDRLLVQACQHRAHNESAMKARRQRDIWADRRKRAARGEGIQTVLPSWICRGEDGELQVIPDRAEAIKHAAKLILTMGCRKAAARLTAGPDARPCWLERGRWDAEVLSQIFRRPAVWGAYQPMRMNDARRLVPHGDLVRGHYPAVLSEEEATQVKRAMKARGSPRGRPSTSEGNGLTCIAKDAETGENLRLKRNTGASVTDYLDRVWQGGSQIVCPYHVLETLVLRAVQEWTPDALTVHVDPASLGQRQTLEAELASIAADREGIRQQLGKPGRAASTAAILADQLDHLDTREAEVKEALADADQDANGVPPAALRDCQSLAVQIANLRGPELRQARETLNARLKEVLQGVWVYRRRLTKHNGELVVQVWPRVGDKREFRVFVGKPPRDYQPLDIAGADFRLGYPTPLKPLPAKKRRSKWEGR